MALWFFFHDRCLNIMSYFWTSIYVINNHFSVPNSFKALITLLLTVSPDVHFTVIWLPLTASTSPAFQAISVSSTQTWDPTTTVFEEDCKRKKLTFWCVCELQPANTYFAHLCVQIIKHIDGSEVKLLNVHDEIRLRKLRTSITFLSYSGIYRIKSSTRT